MISLIAAMCFAQAAGDVERLVRDLHDDEPANRERAVEELCKIGKPALEALGKVAEGDDPTAKALALKAIQEINWGKGERVLREYVDKRFDEKAEMTEVEVKAVAPWLPDVRFFQIAETQDLAGAGGMGMVMGGGGKTSLFALRQDESAFHRICVKGIFAPQSLIELLKERDVRLATHEEALDFAAAFLDLYSMVSGGNSMSYVVGYGGPSLQKTASGWDLSVSNYGFQFTFQTDAEGKLTDIINGGSRIYGTATDPAAEERNKLEVEKLKLELELLKRQLEKP